LDEANTKSRKVNGSIPDEVTGSFNSSYRKTMPLAEMSSRNLPGGKEWPTCMAETQTTICEAIVYRMWEPQHLTILQASMDSFIYFIHISVILFKHVMNQNHHTREPVEQLFFHQISYL
jgi:hypothetical protein